MTLAATIQYLGFQHKQEEFRLYIYDTTDAISANYDLFCEEQGATIKWSGSGNEVYKPIISSTLDCNIVVDNGTNEIMVNALITSEEGRFVCKLISRNKGSAWRDEWKGKVINNYSNVVYDSFPYTYTLTAIDGLGDLKNIQYDRGASWYLLGNTMAIHLGNILRSINNLDELYGTNDPFYEFLTSWVETSYVTTTTWESVSMSRHEYFYTVEEDGKFTYDSCQTVLEKICERFLLRVRQVNGIFRFEQLTALAPYATAIDRFKKARTYLDTVSLPTLIDTTDTGNSYHFAGYPSYHIVPPIKWATVTVKDYPELNLAFAETWTHLSTSLENLGEVLDNDASYFKIRIYIDFKTETNGGTYVKHHYKFKVTFKVGTDYLVQGVTFHSGHTHDYGDPSWSGSSGYVYVIGWAEFETTGGLGDILGGGDSYVELLVSSPVIQSSSDLEVQVERDSLLDKDGATISEAGAPWNGFTYTWTARVDIKVWDSTNEPEDLEFVGIHNEANHEIHNFETLFIDTSENWKKSSSHVTTYRVEELLIQEITELFYDPFKMIQGTLLSNGGDDRIMPEKIFFAGFGYMFIQGTWTTGLSEINGDWYVSDLAKSGGAPSITSTSTDKFLEKGAATSGIRTTATEAAAQTIISISPPGEAYLDGDAVKFTDRATLLITRTTLNGDILATDTTLTINDALAVELASWSLVEITPQGTQTNTKEYYEIFEDSGMTAYIGLTYVTITVGTLPTPFGGSIRRICEVWRNGIKNTYAAAQTKNSHFGIDNGNNRIDFFRALTANDVVEVKFTN